jgi:hypothetical protein
LYLLVGSDRSGPEEELISQLEMLLTNRDENWPDPQEQRDITFTPCGKIPSLNAPLPKKKRENISEIIKTLCKILFRKYILCRENESLYVVYSLRGLWRDNP